MYFLKKFNVLFPTLVHFFPEGKLILLSLPSVCVWGGQQFTLFSLTNVLFSYDLLDQGPKVKSFFYFFFQKILWYRMDKTGLRHVHMRMHELPSPHPHVDDSMIPGFSSDRIWLGHPLSMESLGVQEANLRPSDTIQGTKLRPDGRQMRPFHWSGH